MWELGSNHKVISGKKEKEKNDITFFIFNTKKKFDKFLLCVDSVPSEVFPEFKKTYIVSSIGIAHYLNIPQESQSDSKAKVNYFCLILVSNYILELKHYLKGELALVFLG